MDSGSAWVVEVSTPGAFTKVVDVTSSMGAGGTTKPGQTTHCSAFKHMYINAVSASGDVIISVDLVAKRVDKITQIAANAPNFDSIWGTCDGSGVIGGVSWTPGAGAASNSTAQFGTLSSSGSYTLAKMIGVPPGLEPTGLLTATSPANYADAFLAAAYPVGTLSNATDVKGYTWAVDPYGGGGDDFVAPIPFYLIGAAWTRE